MVTSVVGTMEPVPRYPAGVTGIAAPERDIVSWEDLDRLVADLADRLSGMTFDVMLAITRGGMVPAGMLAYRLRLRDILVAAVEYYDDHRCPPLVRARKQGVTSDSAKPLARPAAVPVPVSILAPARRVRP